MCQRQKEKYYEQPITSKSVEKLRQIANNKVLILENVVVTVDVRVSTSVNLNSSFSLWGFKIGKCCCVKALCPDFKNNVQKGNYHNQ